MKKSYIFAGCVLVAILAFIILLPTPQETADQQDKEESSAQAGVIRKHSDLYGKKDASDDDAKATVAQAQQGETTLNAEELKDGEKQKTIRAKNIEESKQRIETLEKLAADEKTRDQARNMAKQMLQGNRLMKTAAIQTLMEIGDKESASVLLDFIDNGSGGGGDSEYEEEDVYDPIAEALAAMEELIQSNLFEDDLLLTTNEWIDLFKQCRNEDELTTFLNLLSSYKVEVAAPILLAYYESSDKRAAQYAKEYLQFVANGREFNSRDEALAWYNRDVRPDEEPELK